MSTGGKVSINDGELDKAEHRRYRMGTATLLYLSCTVRPDLCYVASQLGKVQHAPTDSHMAILKRAIAYCVNTRNYGPTYRKVDYR